MNVVGKNDISSGAWQIMLVLLIVLLGSNGASVEPTRQLAGQARNSNHPISGGQLHLVVRSDGNIVLYRGARAVWVPGIQSR